MFEKLKEKIREYEFNRAIKHIEITPKGKYVVDYCKRNINGEYDYIEDYEWAVETLQKPLHCTRLDAMKILVNMTEMLEGKPVTDYTFDTLKTNKEKTV